MYTYIKSVKDNKSLDDDPKQLLASADMLQNSNISVLKHVFKYLYSTCNVYVNIRSVFS